jgi:hypothetical protein
VKVLPQPLDLLRLRAPGHPRATASPSRRRSACLARLVSRDSRAAGCSSRMCDRTVLACGCGLNETKPHDRRLSYSPRKCGTGSPRVPKCSRDAWLAATGICHYLIPLRPATPRRRPAVSAPALLRAGSAPVTTPRYWPVRTYNVHQ